jgi:hypothetical protein
MKLKGCYFLPVILLLCFQIAPAQSMAERVGATSSPCANNNVLSNWIAALDNSNETIQLRAVEKLAACGPEAAAAMDKLAALTDSHNIQLRNAAFKAYDSVTGTKDLPLAEGVTKPKMADSATENKNNRKADDGTKSNLSLAVVSLDKSAATLDVSHEGDLIASNYFVIVEHEKDSGTVHQPIEKPSGGTPKNPQQITVKLNKGPNTITVYADVPAAERAKYTARIQIDCNEECIASEESFTQSTNFRAVVGFEQVGASSANSEQHPFLDFYISAPLFGDKTKNCAHDPCAEGEHEVTTRHRQFSLWSDVKFTTTAVQTLSALPNLAATLQTSGKPNDLVQSFDFLAGFEYELIRPGPVFKSIFGSRSSVSLIVSGGAINPLSSDKTTTFYKVPRVNNGADIDPAFLKLFPEAAGKTNVAFVSPERARFFRQYYGGLRFKTLYYEGKDKMKNVLPAMFDVTFGQNEAITNHLKGVILRLDGSTPFPIKGNDFLYLFGSAQMKMGRNVNQPIPPFFLEPSASGTTLTNNDTVAIPIDRSPYLRSNRDVFKIGVGVDLTKIFGKKDEPKQ